MRLVFAALVAPLVLAACAEPKPWTKPPSEELTCEEYGHVERGNAVLYNNTWNAHSAGDYPWRQCLERRPGPGQPVYGWSWDWPTGERHIYGYPQIKFGTSPWDPLPHLDQRFPASIASLKSLRITHKIEAEATGSFNIAASFWLTSTNDFGPEPNREVIRAEVMVWTHHEDNHISPAGERIGVITHDGREWSVWLDRNWGDASGANANRWIYLVFRAEQPTLDASFDLMALLRTPILADLRLEQYYVADAEIGSEVMGGKGLIWVRDATVAVVQ